MPGHILDELPTSDIQRIRNIAEQSRKHATRIDADFFLGASSLQGALLSSRGKEMSPEDVVATLATIALTSARKLCTTRVNKQIRKGNHYTSSLALGGRDHQNHFFLARQEYLIWLRAAGILPSIPYDVVQQKHLYRHRDASEPTKLAEDLETLSFVRGKRCLELGPGGGRDSDFFAVKGAKSVHMIEGSQVMVDALRQKFSTTRLNCTLPEEAEDLFAGLERFASLIEKNKMKPFDLISAHSVTHLFNDREFFRIIQLCHRCLSKNGVLALAMKTPGALFDNPDHAISLINHESETTSCSPDLPDTCTESRSILLHWLLNLDGQTRAFRSESVIENIVNYAGFATERKTVYPIDDFEVRYSTQNMCELISRKRENTK